MALVINGGTGNSIGDVELEFNVLQRMEHFLNAAQHVEGILTLADIHREREGRGVLLRRILSF